MASVFQGGFLRDASTGALVVSAVSALSPTILGNNAIGGTVQGASFNYKTVIPVTAPSAGTVKIESYVGGDGSNAGTALFKGVVYQGASLATATLMGTGAEASVSDVQAPGWVTLADGIPVAAGAFWAGQITGDASTLVAAERYATAADGASFYNADTYSDGPTATFGTPISTTKAMSYRVTFTPDAPAYIEGVDVGGALVTELAATGDVSVSTAGGVATITSTFPAIPPAPDTVLLSNFPLPASAVLTSDPIEMGGKLLTAAAVADVNGTLLVEDSLDASAWRARTAGAAAAVASAAVPVVRPYARVTYTNGATIQAEFELARTVA